MEQLLLTRKAAAETLSISVDTLDELRARNLIKSIHIGSRVYITPDALREFVSKECRMMAM